MSFFEAIGQSLIYGILIGGLYGLAALGLSLVFGVMRYLNVAHGSLIMIGSYLTFLLFSLCRINLFLAIPIVMLNLFIIGLILYKIMFSPLAKYSIEARTDNSLLISFGLMLAIDNLAAMIWTADERIVITPLSGITFGIFGLRVPYVGLISLGLTLFFAYSLHLFLGKTRFGKAIRATSQDWEAATTLGVNIGYTYLISFGISTALAGIAGALLSLNYAFNPSISEGWSIKALIIITLAGLGRIGGVFAAGLILGAVEAVSVYFIGASNQQVVGLVIFILLLLFRPQGLFIKPARERRRWHLIK